MKKFVRILSLVLILVLCLSLTACDTKKYGQWYDKKNGKADQRNLYGMCAIFTENIYKTAVSPLDLVELMHNMGVTSVRNWMHFTPILTDKDTVNQAKADELHAVLAKEKEYGMQIIGMNHHSFTPEGYENSGKPTSKPRRDLSEGSVYMQWLEDYEQSWFTLVSEFPEVEYWEIDNECNNPTFMPLLEGGNMTVKSQMAEVFTDMLFFASRGIHRANPNAITVMGGIVPKGAPGFMQMMYDCIFEEGSWSPYPDDYFQVAAWHAYDDRVSEREITVNTWVADQQKIYDVIKQNEGKDKKVFITEYGWSETNIKQATIEKNLENVFTRVKKDLPFIEAMHYFRMFEAVNVWSGAALTAREFGLFNDPSAVFPNKENYVMGAPKPTAYTFQRLAGGSGDLTILQKD